MYAFTYMWVQVFIEDRGSDSAETGVVWFVSHSFLGAGDQT